MENLQDDEQSVEQVIGIEWLQKQVHFKRCRIQDSVNKNKNTVKPVYKGHSQKQQKFVFKPNYRLMQVKSIAECSPWSILQYF